ncbi:MAG: hypothetical protein IPG86_20995 [Chitinophagaceae bacterium]|nr:hypothetical protein [Chitinophagaceae bacterium]
MKMGWSRYSIINLQYKNQVVAKIRGADDVSADSLRTRQMMEIIAANAAKYAEDSTLNFKQDDRKNNDSSMIQHLYNGMNPTIMRTEMQYLNKK